MAAVRTLYRVFMKNCRSIGREHPKLIFREPPDVSRWAKGSYVDPRMTSGALAVITHSVTSLSPTLEAKTTFLTAAELTKLVRTVFRVCASCDSAPHRRRAW